MTSYMSFNVGICLKMIKCRHLTFVIYSNQLQKVITSPRTLRFSFFNLGDFMGTKNMLFRYKNIGHRCSDTITLKKIEKAYL